MEIIFHKSFREISCSDIKYLISISYKERQGIEYKKEMYGRSDQDKKEMIRDISSMANAYGGYLIIGIEADESGIPVRPINIDEAETERNRIEQSCLSNIEPRILGLEAKTIALETGENLIIIHVPRSTKKPHMITFQGANQFWIRHNDRKILMSSEEIRTACINVENLWTEIKQFFIMRNLELIEETATGGFLVLGSSPIFINDDFIDINDHNINNFLISPPYQTVCDNLSFNSVGFEDIFPIPTLDGLNISYPQWNSVELKRNGYYEIIISIDNFTFPLHGSKAISFSKITNYVVNYFRALKGLKEIVGLEQDIISFMSLYNIEGLILQGNIAVTTCGIESVRAVEHSWPKRNLQIKPKFLLSLNNHDKEAKYFLDRLWNGYGYKKAPYFTNDIFTPQ